MSNTTRVLSAALQSIGKYFYPADTSRHLATILGFPSKYSISHKLYDDACWEIASLAACVARFEPVRLYARPEDVSSAQAMVNDAGGANRSSNVAVIQLPTNHLWVRDTGPVYVYGTDPSTRRQRFAINFGFSEWGKKNGIGAHDQILDDDWPCMTPAQLEENATFATRVIATDTDPSPVSQVDSKICLEGGALIVDGEGTLLATESSIINENRNPNLSRSAIEAELRDNLGVSKIIWFPGRHGLDITDVHIDAELNFIRPGVIALSRPHPDTDPAWLEVHKEINEILLHETDAKGRRLEIHMIDEPDPKGLPSGYEDAATNYVNFYFVNGGLIIPHFGDRPRDLAALETLQRLCPDREVRPLQVRALPLTGGVIHCATQPIIAPTGT